MKFRKKPVVIEAEQFNPETSSPVDNTTWGRLYKCGVFSDPMSKTKWSIETLEGKHEVTVGDWIITGVKGERYPCKPDIFEMTYEKVE